MELMGFTAIPAITVLCIVLGILIKATKIDDKYIPIACGIFGTILGIAAFFLMPEYPADDIVTAMALGAVSGLAATGAHQLCKQLDKNDKTNV